MNEISIRKDTCNERPRLRAFRPRARSYPLGEARQTPSGKWLVCVTGYEDDAFDSEREAREILLRLASWRAAVRGY